MSTDGTSAPWDPSVRSDPGALTAAMLADPDLPPEVLLPRILDPFLWAEVTPVSNWRLGDLLYLDVRGYPKWKLGDLPDPGEISDQMTIYAMARQARSFLVGRAEEAVAAVEAAGFRHESHPVIEAGGTLSRGRRGEPDVLRAEVLVRMSLVPPS